MKLWLLCGGVALLLAGLEAWRRRLAYWQGPNLRQQLREWHAADPVITPAQLPDVKPLQVTRRRLVKLKAEPLHGKFKRQA